MPDQPSVVLPWAAKTGERATSSTGTGNVDSPTKAALHTRVKNAVQRTRHQNVASSAGHTSSGAVRFSPAGMLPPPACAHATVPTASARPHGARDEKRCAAHCVDGVSSFRDLLGHDMRVFATHSPIIGASLHEALKDYPDDDVAAIERRMTVWF